MLRSMTAFGRHSVSTAAGEFNWELRSVNNRYLETAVRLPEEVRVLEPEIRKIVSTRLNRGKVDVGLRRQGVQVTQDAQLSVNQTVLGSLHDALVEVESVVLDAPKPSSLDLLQWPGVLAPTKTDTEALHQALLAGFDAALNDFVAMREREGQATAALLSSRVVEIRTKVEALRIHRPEVVARQRERLMNKLADLDVPADSHRLEADSHRLEQELIYVAQRLDIDEELDRLDHHLDEVQSVLERKDPVGRRLDFLMQELNREANTLGSKSSDVDTTGASVDIKVLIEQMREQVQNLE